MATPEELKAQEEAKAAAEAEAKAKAEAEAAAAAEAEAKAKAEAEAKAKATPPAGTGDQPKTPAGEDDAAKRYSELTARTKAAERAAAEAAERERMALDALSRLGQQPPPKKAEEQEPVEPVMPEWKGDPVEYSKEMAKYTAELSSFAAAKGAKAAIAEDQAKRTKDAQAETTRRIQAEWATRRAAAIARLPDYEVVAENPALKISDTMATAITVDPDGADVAYYLGRDLAEASRIAALPPGQQLVEFGKITAKVAAARRASTTTKTPPPITKPTGSGSSQSVDVADLPMDDYAKQRNEKLAAEKRAGRGAG